MGATFAEKVLARASGNKEVTPGTIVTARVDRAWITTMADAGDTLEKYGVGKIWDPDRTFVVHGAESAPPASIETANRYERSRQACTKHGVTNLYDFGEHGSCHLRAMETDGVRPGELVIGDDVDIRGLGAVNVAATPVPEISYVLTTGELWFEVPESIRWILTGDLPQGVFAKDVALHMAGKYGADAGLMKSLEFAGPAVERMSLESRLTLACMTGELGAAYTAFEADQAVLDWAIRSGLSYEPVWADADAAYHDVRQIDISVLEPQVACPHSIENVKSVSEVRGTAIQQAYLGGPHAHYEDIETAAYILHGKRIHPEVRMIVTPATQEIFNRMIGSGLVKLLMDAEVVVTGATAGAEAGTHAGILGADEVAISAGTRNYQGRMGSADSLVYLASSACVAASALAGEIADPRDYL